MFAEINVCIFETKPCLQLAQVLLIIYMYMNYGCGYLFLWFNDGHDFRQIKIPRKH